MGSWPPSVGGAPLVLCPVSWLSLGPPGPGLSPPHLTGWQVQQRTVRPLPRWAMLPLFSDLEAPERRVLGQQHLPSLQVSDPMDTSGHLAPHFSSWQIKAFSPLPQITYESHS